MSTQEHSTPEYSRLMRRTLKLQRKAAKEFHYALRCAREALAGDRTELALSWCEYGATLALFSNPGFFYSQEMEQLLSEIGRRYLPPAPPTLRRTEAPKRFLHILTVAYEKGGHTRAVARWIGSCAQYGPAEQHSVLISMQADTPLPAWLGESARKSGGEVFVLSSSLSRLQAAAEMRAKSSDFDAIILHIHPNDLLPNIAFSDYPGLVLFFSHADHLFSMGTGVARVIADIRSVGHDLSLRFRSPAARKVFLPLPLPEGENGWWSKTDARRKLGLPLDAQIALTIGDPYKFAPVLEYDFSAIVRSLCAANPRIFVVAVGISESEPFPGLGKAVGGRFMAAGVVKDPDQLELYYHAADVYLDPVPCTSFTATLDAAQHGLPVQRLHFPYQPLTWCDDPGLDSIATAASTADDYVAGVLGWLKWPEETRTEFGRSFRDAILREHCGASWKTRWLDPAIAALGNASWVGFPSLPESVGEQFSFFGLGSWVAEWPAGMFVAGAILRGGPLPLRIRVSGILHSIRPMLFDTPGNGNAWKRFLIFWRLVGLVEPREILATLRKTMRAAIGN